MPVQYTSTAGTTQLVPAPMASVNKQYDRLGDGTIVGVRYEITLTGKLLAFKGSPGSKASAGDINSYQAAIQSSQKAIRDLFADEGGQLDITPWNGSASQITCYPRLTSIEFSSRDPVSWFNVCDYTITLEADYVDGDWSTNEDKFDFAIASAQETFEFGEEDGSYQYSWNAARTDLQTVGKIFRFSRNISATGKKRYDDSGAGPGSPSPLKVPGGGEAWQQASGYVLTKSVYYG
jgi:PAS domain-containing protein